ncbi:MAG: hypothetical protein AAF558_07730 [Verrucomicrobiota bacterium]
MQRDKKQEWTVYRRLKLDRKHKSRAKRSIVEGEGIYCFVGGTRGRPYLKVLKADYVRFWREEEAKSRKSILYKKLPTHRAADLLRLQLEKNVYDRLLAHHQALSHLESATRQREGRTLSAHEKEIYSKALDENPVSLNEQSRAKSNRKRWIHSVLGRIEDRNESHPDRLQNVWQNLVGVEEAKHVCLNNINSKRGIAYCRSTNPAMSYKLRQRQDLPKLLSEALGIKVSKIVYR